VDIGALPRGLRLMAFVSEQEDLNLKSRHRKAKIFARLCAVITWASVLLLAVLLYQVCVEGLGWIDWQFISSSASRFPERSGIKAALVGTLYLIVLIAIFSIPVGISAALYLEEFAGKGRISRLIELNISNLSGVPSIVYGILGLAIFVRFFALERSLISGALTMSLLILPTIIIAGREAIRTVPMSIRYAALSLGATRWQTTWAHVLPAAFPGIMTGVILALSRAIGETAPLIMIGATAFITFTPQNLLDSFTVLPIQIFNWISLPQQEFHQLAAAGILVLLVVLLLMNATAIYIRSRTERRMK
jgi:phosphate transport system permease protein